MTASVAPVREKIKGKSRHWRGWHIVLLVIAGCFVAWFGWDYWQAAADERALKEYLAELDRREPNWRERVYGKEATVEQAESRRKLNELYKAMPTYDPAWVPYREGLYQGMYNDPAHPAARLPEEQVAFLNWAREYLKPFREKLPVVDTLVPLNRFLLKDEPYEKMLTIVGHDFTAAFMVNEPIGLEIIYYLQKNQPEEATNWLRRSLHLQAIRYESSSFRYDEPIPFLVERLLNLTQPNGKTLEKLQIDLEKAVGLSATKTLLHYASECRMHEKTVQAISRGELKSPQLERIGFFYWLIPKDSHWNDPWLKFARPYYLRSLVRGMYYRPLQVTLKLHQLADQVEALATLPQDQRWLTWKSFIEANGLPASGSFPSFPNVKSPGSDAIPDGVFYLVPFPNSDILFQFHREVQMKTALVALAAERFRLDHGRFPKEWSELVPSYLSEVIIDPFTGKPLILKNNDKGLVIYSPGAKGIDEGGEDLSSIHYWNYGGKRLDWKKTNIGTRVYLPQFRRAEPIQLDEFQKEGLNKWKVFEAEQKKKAEQSNK